MPFAIRTALSFVDPAGGGVRFWYLQVKRRQGFMCREWITDIAHASTWSNVGDAKRAFICAVELGVKREAIMIVPVVLAEGEKLHHRGPFKVTTKNYSKVIVPVDYRDISRSRSGIKRHR